MSDTPLLTVLSFGAGQDSTAILYRLVFDPEFRDKYAPGILLVVMSDTGNEHPDTYAHVNFVKRFCREHGIEFWFLHRDLGFHTEAWATLQTQYERTSTVGSKCGFKKTCSDNLKMKVIYRFLEQWLSEKYRLSCKNKQGIVQFAEKYGPIRMLIGIAAGEEKRIAKTADQGAVFGKWFVSSIRRVYPLIEVGWGRAECQAYIRSVGMNVPPPSCCVRCPFKSEVELLWTYRNLPEEYEAWVLNEAAKLKKFEHLGDRNLGVFGRKSLPVVLAEAQKKYADWTDEQLEEYRMSHGHCTMTSY